MKIIFNKYEGAGNDFIIIDNRNNSFNSNPELISKLCHRRFGIGADGLILLNSNNDFDFEMKYFNADGYEGTMCGNGGRCIIEFANRLGIINNKTNFISIDGEHSGHVIKTINNTSTIKLLMNDVEDIKFYNDDYFLDTGSPHYVKFVSDLENYDVTGEGKKLRHQTNLNKNGTNVDFVEIKNETLYVRTYERGVEDETLSCGTGVTASALAASEIFPQKNYFNIVTKGGKLKVSFIRSKNKFYDILLEGQATFVFKGEIDY